MYNKKLQTAVLIGILVLFGVLFGLLSIGNHLCFKTYGLDFGVWSAMGSDYHSNVPSAMLLPWLLYFIKQEKLGMASIMVIAIIIAKETQALWVFFVLLGLLWDYRKDARTRRWPLFSMLGTTLYAVVEILLIHRSD